MPELATGSIDLTVTSPPYWQIKDYHSPGQIGHGQTLHAYLHDLEQVWRECFRLTRESGRLCVNVGDQFARASLHGRYRVIPLHAEIICQCVAAGWDYMGSIVWRKKTTMNTSGGATVMGSYPYPPNGIIEIDFEYILLFKRPGPARKIDRRRKEAAAISKEDWKSWFSGHWDIGGARKKGHEAPFPEEIPRRLIRMFSFPGDTVLDPFLGTGTTALVALSLGRNAVGYEISAEYVRMARKRVRAAGGTLSPARASARARISHAGSSIPRTPDMPAVAQRAAEGPRLFTVAEVGDDCSLTLDTGERVRFSGLAIRDTQAARAYLRARVLKKRVFLKDAHAAANGAMEARVVLKNRISINAQLIRSGAAEETAQGSGGSQ
jgi:modification methylase